MSDELDASINEKVASIILAGGKGTRLFPLTQSRSKPAVSFGGKYRLIDVPISNSLNSKIRRIFVISQYFASNLQQHLSSAYAHNPLSNQNLEMLCPEETSEGTRWFKGTADAVRQNLKHLKDPLIEYYLILSGDQLYNIDLLEMVQFAKKKNADLVVASLPIKESEATRMGVLKIEPTHHISDFYEKPQTPDLLDKFQFKQDHNKETLYLGSMGIYVFKKEALINLLKEAGDDFGKDLIPLMISQKNSFSFVYDGYWEDIGTISSFYQASLALIDQKKNGLDICNPRRPIYTQRQHLPSALIKGTEIEHSVISPGCIIKAKNIRNSIVGTRTHIQDGSVVLDSVISGNPSSFTDTPLQIGKNCLIQKAIIDEHTSIGDHVELTNKKNQMHYDGDGIFIRDGIIIVTSGTVVPDHFVL